MSIEKIEFIVPQEYHLERIDRFLSNSLEIDLSRSYIQRLIKNSNIIVNGKEIKQNYKLKYDDKILLEIPEPVELRIDPLEMPIEIIFEDDFIAIINKQPGLVVHPGPGNWDRTLVHGLLYCLKDLSSIGGAIRPGIVHRLDKDTSGLMVIAKNDQSHKFLSEEFAKRRVIKKYNAIVIGKPKLDHEVIDCPIGRHPKYRHKMTVTEKGKNAISEYFLMKMWNGNIGLFSHLEIRIHTGRSHQIRVHLSSKGFPIVGDPIYSKRVGKYRVPFLLLASTNLEFTHPKTGEWLKFDVSLPEHIKKFIHRLDSTQL